MTPYLLILWLHHLYQFFYLLCTFMQCWFQYPSVQSLSSVPYLQCLPFPPGFSPTVHRLQIGSNTKQDNCLPADSRREPHVPRTTPSAYVLPCTWPLFCSQEWLIFVPKGIPSAAALGPVAPNLLGDCSPETIPPLSSMLNFSSYTSLPSSKEYLPSLKKNPLTVLTLSATREFGVLFVMNGSQSPLSVVYPIHLTRVITCPTSMPPPPILVKDTHL